MAAAPWRVAFGLVVSSRCWAVGPAKASPEVTGFRGAAPQDRARVATPGEALVSGADLLVIGRPITAALRRTSGSV
ncbi:hypothetical protein Airi02_007550 [Actinoallomurus iriomotensis]|uniref:Uncharacterized protein n=1 Tax=Actinoallomurus iriomotensis TaxID=478107 RepID=A0A9W6RZR7_9ACTN|nr:hypothetical protein Airi02_007550 [Actinoallomurus iriomotensis]